MWHNFRKELKEDKLNFSFNYERQDINLYLFEQKLKQNLQYEMQIYACDDEDIEKSLDVSHISFVQQNAAIINLLKERGKLNTDKDTSKLIRAHQKLDQEYNSALDLNQRPMTAFITF